MVIASVGFLLNIADLLQSSGDGFSDKTGYELVRDKVNKPQDCIDYFPDDFKSGSSSLRDGR